MGDLLRASDTPGPAGTVLSAMVRATDDALRARRALRALRRRGPGPAVDRVAARLRRLRPGDAPHLTVTTCRVTGQLDVSLVVTGPAERLDAVSGLALRSADGCVRPVDTARAGSGDRLRLAATLPEECFERGGSHEVLLRTEQGPLTPGVRDRTVIRHRLSVAALERRGWPMRVSLVGGRLHVRGTRPRYRTIDHSVATTASGCTIEWAAAGEPAASLRLTRRGDLSTVTVDATPEGGLWEAQLDPVALAGESGDWDVHVSRHDGFAPLLRVLGEFPRLGRAVVYPELPVVAVTGAPMTFRFLYTGGNSLAVRVRPVGATP